MKNDISSKLNRYLAHLFVKFAGFGYLPRWIVFCIDMSILVVASVIKYLLLSNLNNYSYDTLDSSTRYILVIAVNGFFFLIFKTYSGIVRHSSFLRGG